MKLLKRTFKTTMNFIAEYHMIILLILFIAGFFYASNSDFQHEILNIKH